MKLISKILLLFIFSVSFLYSQEEKVTLQLKWFHQFQFAGYYAAKEKGFYKEVGLDVQIKQRDIKYNNVEQVINAEAEYGVADSILMLYKAKGKPVVIVSPIFQHSPSVLITLKSSGLNSPYKLDSEDMIFYPKDTDGFSILAMLKKLGVKPNIIRDRGKNDYLRLMNNEVNIIPGYLSNEPFYIKERNIDVNIINPANYGFDLYGDMLFTNKNEAMYYPNRVKKFKEATLKGWEYALNNKEEIIELIHKKYNTNKSLEHLRYEANVIEKLISRDIVPLGYIERGRLKYISSLYEEFGFVNESSDINNFIFDEAHDNTSNMNLSQKELLYLKNNPIIKASNEMDWAPFDFAINNEPKGYSIDLLNMLAKRLDIKIEYINGYSWSELVNLFKEKKIDLLHSLAKNEKREEFGIFSNSYIRYQTHFITRKNNPEINAIEEIDDKTIAVGKGWAIDDFLTKEYPNIKLLRLDSLDEILDAVSSGKAYSAILNSSVANYFIRKKNFINLKVSNWCTEFDLNKSSMLHFFVQKDSPELVSALNKAFDSLSLEDISTLNNKWLNNSSIDKNELVYQEINFIKKHPTIRFRVLPNRPPFEFQRDGKAVGIAVDYVRKSAENMGLKAEFVLNNDSLGDAYTNIESKRDNYDTLLFSVKNKSREERFSFGTPYLSYPMMIVTNKNRSYISTLKDLNNKTVVLEESFLSNKWIKRDYPKINIVNVKNTKEALEMLNDDKVDAYVGNLGVANYLSVLGGLNNIKIAGPSGYGNVRYSFIAPKEWPELTSILSKGFSKITPSEHSALQQKWFSVQTIEKVNNELIWKIIIGVIILFFWFLWWNRKIIIERNKTTEALKELKLSQEERLKQQEIILHQSKIASMGEMIGNIAHQWRQPLSAISASTSGVKLQKEIGILDDKSLNSMINGVLKNTEYLSETIETFRQYIKEGKNYSEVIVFEPINKSLNLLESTFRNNHIKVLNKIDYSTPLKSYIISDELSQVLINIINNAKDALVDKKIKEPILEIDLKRDDNNIIITLEDNAGGIPEDIITRIFEPYFTTKHQSQGTGLGLHMSYKIVVESLKGKLYVKNTEKGAKFFIEIPLYN